MDITKELRQAANVAIATHISPDGDAIGASVALACYAARVRENGAAGVSLLLPQGMPHNLDIVEGLPGVETRMEGLGPYDLCVALDTDRTRLGDALPLYESAGRRLNIDHHVTNSGAGDESVVIPEASSTCEVLYGLLDERYIDADVARALYQGIIHDTGILQYSNVSPHTLEVVAKLLACGIDAAKINAAFYEKTYAQTQILGRALIESVRFMDNRCIVTVITRKMMQFYGVGPDDLDGIVSQLRYVSGVDVAIVLKETDTLTYRVSMRSTEAVDVALVAAFYKGGGHARAAGCTMQGTVHDVINNLSDRIALQG